MLNKIIYLLMSFLLINCAGNSPKHGIQSQEKRKWKRSFEEGETRRGVPEEFISGSANHNTLECSQGNFIHNTVGYSELTNELFKTGSRSFKAGIHPLRVSPCDAGVEFTLRHYPTWHGKFKLPILVMFWMYTDAPNWESVLGNRFSPLTVKGRFPKAPNNQIMTTHILSDGTTEIKHATEVFKNPIPIPLKKWNLQALYIENEENVTRATLYSDGEIVHIAIGDGFWNEEELRHWHMGLYGDDNGLIEEDALWFEDVNPSVDFSIFNDDIQVIEVNNELEAETLILNELGNE